MRLFIEHQTQYVYSEVVTYTIQQLRLTPQSGMGQHVHHWDIKVMGQMHAFTDAFGNSAHTLVIDQPHQELYILVSGEVETGVDWANTQKDLPVPLYLRDTELTAPSLAIREFVKAYQDKPIEILMIAVKEKIQHHKGATNVETTAANAFDLGKGVCQDQVHVMLACCRCLGLPARYVSGYLFTEDGSLMHTHAWVDVWKDDAWVSLDVANGTHVNAMYVRLATGLDYRGASPVSGMRVGGGIEGHATSVTVRREGDMQQKPQKVPHAELIRQARQSQQ